MKGRIAILIIFFSVLFSLSGADTIYVNPANIVMVKVINGDTVLCAQIKEIVFYAPRRFKNKFEYRRYQRLIRNIKKAYPYAKLAKKMLDEVNAKMLTMKTEAERKQYMKQVEKDVKNEFEEELKKLTITQGKILIKLIDRETGSTSYELVKELRGTFSAFFWQALARIFGSNLKTEFDAEGTDRLINEIVTMIENGQL